MNVKEIKNREKLTIKDIFKLLSGPSRKELQDALLPNVKAEPRRNDGSETQPKPNTGVGSSDLLGNSSQAIISKFAEIDANFRVASDFLAHSLKAYGSVLPIPDGKNSFK